MIRRLITPTLLDIFFLAVIGWSFMTSGTGWGRLLWDGDTAIHTATGNWILARGWVPIQDPFSFTMPGAQWLPWEWGTSVLFSLLNTAFGLKGIVFVCGLVIAATVALVLRSAMSAGTGTFAAMALALAANNVLLLHYHARPHIFTLLFFALSIWIINRDRLRPSRAIWLLPPLTILWANLHPGFVLLIGSLGLVAAGYVLEWALDRTHSAVHLAGRYFGVAAACVAAGLVNPFGYRLFMEIGGYFHNSGVSELVEEFQAPTFRTEPQRYYLIFLFAALSLLGILIQRKDFSNALLLVALAYASLTSVRHTTVFVIAAAPVIGREITRIFESLIGRSPPQSALGIVADISRQSRPALLSISLWPAVAVVAIVLYSPESAWPTGFDPTLFPVAMTARHSVTLANNRVFAPEQWADYLILANYPRQRVFFDDRSSLYGARMFREVRDLELARPGSLNLLDRYSVDYALVEPESPLEAALAAQPGWREIDRDRTAVFFQRSP